MDVFAYYLRTVENNSYLVISSFLYETVAEFMKKEIPQEYEYLAQQGYYDDEMPYEEFLMNSAKVEL